MNTLTNQDVQDFIELLVTFGDVNRLGSDMVILDIDGKPHMIRDGESDKPVQILHNGMIKDENNFIFNPFKMIDGFNPAFNWFYNSRILILSNIVKQIIIKAIELSVSKETEDYDILQLLTNVSESCDKLTISELSEINGADYFRITYNKKTKVADAQTLIFSDEIETTHKFRRKTWTAVRNLMRNLFKLKDDETSLSAYSYHATILSIPELDAKLHVIYNVISVLDPWAKLIGYDLRVEDFKKHLENLESYVRMFAWFTAKATSKDEPNELVVSNNAPTGLPVRNDISIPAVMPQVAPAVAPAMPQMPTPMPTPMNTISPMSVPAPNYGMMPMATPQMVNPFQSTVPAMPQMPMAAPMMSVPPVAPQMVNPFQPTMPAPMPTMSVPMMPTPQYTMMGQYQTPASAMTQAPAPMQQQPVINIK